jgi:acyl carrier protein
VKTEKRIKRFIERSLLDDGVNGADPLASGRLDSVEIEQLVVHLEEEFGVAFTDDELVTENFSALSVLAALVDRKQREAS